MSDLEKLIREFQDTQAEIDEQLTVLEELEIKSSGQNELINMTMLEHRLKERRCHTYYCRFPF